MTAVRSPRARDASVHAPGRARTRSTARPLPQESAGPRLRLIRRDGDRRRRDIGWRATVALCVVGSFAALVASVAIQSQRIALQEEADRVSARTAVAEDRNRELRIAVVQAESPEHVLEVARDAGLVEPGPIAVVPAATVPTSTPALPAPPTDDGGATTAAPSTIQPTGATPAKAG
ncbi:hypothetical protein [Dermatobacter hominis]|uniref:hypothetical protein n=1 Tax=Dermatobacter hominis TaxID=2884263 RepID=UPI001D12317B|nr:hypothetical protein [Dermatobacter hominis]UDY35971.1 hypothetical protein LH044_00170 [Dermatobacter hominis]